MLWIDTSTGTDLAPCCADTVRRCAAASIADDSLQVGESIACGHCDRAPQLLERGGLVVWGHYLEPEAKRPRKRRKAHPAPAAGMPLMGVRK